MDIIIRDLSEQDIATLVLAARIRGVPENDWNSFFRPWIIDAYAQVQRTAGTLIADDPVLSGSLLAKLSDHLTSLEELPSDTTTIPETP